MAFTLYDATIPTYVQILNALRGLVDKAEAWCAEKNMPEADLLGLHFGEDMRTLSWQFKWTSTHSIGAIEGVRAGIFSPDLVPPPEGLTGLRAQIDDSIAKLEAIEPAEIESFIGRDMLFSAPHRNFEMHFAAEHFLTSFSMIHFMFHATTAYDLLRDQGLDIGKADFLGRPRSRMPA